jgi:hypothetical protein
MALYDKRDVQMVANVIINLGPMNEFYRACMVAEALIPAGISVEVMDKAMDHIRRK